MIRILEDIACALVGLGGVLLLLLADSSVQALAGVGCLVLVTVFQLRLVTVQQRRQTDLLLLIAEAQHRD
ncbi:hypothetical protein GUY44_27925 [Pimelobacter simplex]|uniref:hypothetical protein n=1 Tax=Nocardioides simplex TaxID=2045 RepID=UPI000535ABFD|nr:hypothetical protein [Pimelobacter simplex]MCG8154331.1 hypothetical protein [Pimelobacter simplex]GEB11770.1 hypothetical protein NSI01_00850 [Pimelobacter simplex]SFN01433.1 hypothetical protein SAMN05421671_4631 [Pimelobacter simplex]